MAMTVRTSIPTIYTPEDVAIILGCSRVHVYRLIKSGEVKAIDISDKKSKRTKYRITEAQLKRYITNLGRRKRK